MNHIDHGLWVSDIETVRTEPTQRFDLVVSVCQDTCQDNVGCTYMHYELADDDVSEDNWGGSCDYEMFRRAVVAVVKALDDDFLEDILVHCHKGRNRSVAVCVAALAVYENTGHDAAFGKVGAARKCPNPNDLMKSHVKRYITEH